LVQGRYGQGLRDLTFGVRCRGPETGAACMDLYTEQQPRPAFLPTKGKR